MTCRTKITLPSLLIAAGLALALGLDGRTALAQQDAVAQADDEKKGADEAKPEEAKADEKKEELKQEEAKPDEAKKDEEKKEDEKADETKEEPKKEEPKKEEKKPAKKIDAKSEAVLTGLDNPCGVAVQSGSNQVYVAESGALKVLRIKEDGKAEDVITDFPQDVYGKGPKYNIGPLGLDFLNKSTLIVGGGGKPDGEELLRFYDVPEAGKSIKADAMKHTLGPIGPGEQSKKGEGNFYDIAVAPDAIYVTCNGDDTKGWVSRAELKGGTPGELKPYIATKQATEVDAPVGIAINRLGHVVVGQMGEINVPGDSLLTFYGPKSRRLLLNLETGLHDIAGLAYSPKGRLYAIDFAWMDPSQGGLYRLDDDGQGGVEAVKVMSLDKPTSLAFATDGTLYVTEIGSAAEGAAEKPGRLLKITGDL